MEGEDDPEAELADREVHLPPMAEGDPASVADLEPGIHATQPPARYTEASLVKAMEDLGVGRPSTYASVIATILDRGYVWKKGTALVPSFTAFAVVGLLERYFADLVDYGFTASMEDDLDAIASGTEESLPWLTRFYFGGTEPANGLGRQPPVHTGRRPTGRQRTERPVAGHRRASGSSARSAPTWARSTPGRSTPSPSGWAPTGGTSWPGSAATAPTSSGARTGCPSPRTWPPTS